MVIIAIGQHFGISIFYEYDFGSKKHLMISIIIFPIIFCLIYKYYKNNQKGLRIIEYFDRTHKIENLIFHILLNLAISITYPGLIGILTKTIISYL